MVALNRCPFFLNPTIRTWTPAFAGVTEISEGWPAPNEGWPSEVSIQG